MPPVSAYQFDLSRATLPCNVKTGQSLSRGEQRFPELMSTRGPKVRIIHQPSAMPQQAMPQVGSAWSASSNTSLDALYQNEC
jgi:hypothetical protein